MSQRLASATGYRSTSWSTRIETELPPPTLKVALQLSEFAGVSVMFSGLYAFSHQPPPFSDLDHTVREIGRAYGLDRLLWASDWPWIQEVPGYDALQSHVDHFFPEATPDERAAVMGDNRPVCCGSVSGADMPVPAVSATRSLRAQRVIN